MSANRPILQEVTDHLPWLFEEFGFRVIEDGFEPQIFGNSFVTLASPFLRVRLVRDRGQVAAEVAACCDPTVWWDLEHVCELISGRSVEPGFDLLHLAVLLRNHLPELSNHLGPNYAETKCELERLAEERKKTFKGRIAR